MKNHLWFRSVCSGLIGLSSLLVATPIARAADIGAPVLEHRQDQPARARQPVEKSADLAAQGAAAGTLRSRGPQGPIRTEFSERESKAGEAMLRNDLQMRRYPMHNGAGIP